MVAFPQWPGVCPPWIICRKTMELHITNRCNKRCPNCEACVWQAPDDSEMSVWQVIEFLQASKRLGIHYHSIKLQGGEPTLHPDYWEILDLLGEYVRWNREHRQGRQPKTKVVTFTNWTTHGAIRKHFNGRWPGWMRFYKSNPDEPFVAVQQAPCDVPEARTDYVNACPHAWMCGPTLAPDGLYYPCQMAYVIARVFCYDYGISGLEQLMGTPDSWFQENVWPLACRVCGFFGESVKSHEQLTSPTWQAALEAY